MLIKAAFQEAVERYPNSVEALVWFATASGLFGAQLTAADLAWAGSVQAKKLGVINVHTGTTQPEKPGVTTV